MAGNKSASSNQIISLPKGGGALQGIGEKFSPDLFTGTGNFTVPITLPPGRNGFQPQLNIAYSTGNGNGPFGLGWQLSIPGIARKTSKGIPKYNDNSLYIKDWDTFILSGTEDLVPVSLWKYKQSGNTTKLERIDNPTEQDFATAPVVEFRPRTESLFARIYRHRHNNDYWEVRSKDGLVSFYGLPDVNNTNPVIADPDNPSKIFAWKLSKTQDPFDNVIEYIYERDSTNVDGLHKWDQIYLSEIRYVDYEDNAGNTKFLVTVKFVYEEERPDKSSEYRAGFEIRTTRRCTKIEIHTHPDGQDILTRTYHLIYLDAAIKDGIAKTGQKLPINGVSLLSQIRVQGHDGERTEWMPPLEFSYTQFEPNGRKFIPITGEDTPPSSLSNPAFEMVDINADGLPDVIELNNTIARYWLNLGNGTFDRPKEMREAPLGIRLSDPGVQLIDANGDGRIDLLVTTDDGLSGYFTIGNNTASRSVISADGNGQLYAQFDSRSFHKYEIAPSFNLRDPEVKLVDLDGDGVIDALRSGTTFELFLNDPKKGWVATRSIERRQLDEFPDVNFSDPRIKLADMLGDGLQDVVMIFDGNVSYWPYLGYGKWGKRIVMQNNPRFPFGYDPRRILIGDVDGDGLADIVYVDDKKVTLWINQSGNSWADPITIEGTPIVSDMDSVRLADMLGSGISGVLWTSDRNGLMKHNMFFLDFTGGVKPYLMNEMNNNMGAITRVGYISSTKFFIQDRTKQQLRWNTSLPFPVLVVDRVEVIDEISKGKLTTQYIYHHGYWDGAEREFRGFGRVDHRDTEFFDDYHSNGVHSEDKSFIEVPKQFFSPPTETRTWFHQGPVGEEYGAWFESDYSNEYWPEDPNVLDTAKPKQMTDFLNLLKGQKRRIKRDAIRTLRGRMIRTELYALDSTSRQDRPYTVTEYLHGILPLPIEQPFAEPQMEDLDRLSELDISHQLDRWRYQVWFPCLLAIRKSLYERGNDPMIQFNFTSDYDEYGQSRSQIMIAVPRARDYRINDPTARERYLSTHTITKYSRRDDGEKYIVDKNASTTTYEIKNDGKSDIFTLKQEIESKSVGAIVKGRPVIGHIVNYYDGAAFVGLSFGQIGDYGALVRTETLVLTDEILQQAYKSGDAVTNPPEIPPYLVHDGAPIAWTDEYPQEFRDRLKPLAGYFYHSSNTEPEYETGYYSATERRRYDFHNNPVEGIGLVTVRKDALGNETEIDYERYGLLAETVTDSIGLEIRASYDYRAVKPNSVIDQNSNRTIYRYTPIGLLKSTATMGKDSEEVGDSPDHPSTIYFYEFMAFVNSPKEQRQPVSISTFRRENHYWSIIQEENALRVANNRPLLSLNEIEMLFPSNEVEAFPERFVRSVEYSDGFGRVIQSRIQAEDNAGDLFGNLSHLNEQDDGTETESEFKIIRNSTEDVSYVVVSGWQNNNNKGAPVVRYEPFFSVGWSYQPPLENILTASSTITTFYDAKGEVIRTRYGDGSEEQIIYGKAADQSKLDPTDVQAFEPTPWEVYTYDNNDNAGRTHGNESMEYRSHWNTPSSRILDALGRISKMVVRNSTASDAEWYVTELTYDIRGNIQTSKDPLGREAQKQVCDLANRPLFTKHIDSGVHSYVIDANGNEIERRDSKEAMVLFAYDKINRLTFLWARDKEIFPTTLREVIEYGDGSDRQQSDEERTTNRNNNRLGRIYNHFDEAGRMTFEQYDFRGNALEKARRVIRDEVITSIIDSAENWQITPFFIDWKPPDDSSIDEHIENLLDTVIYKSSFQYDALDRIKVMLLPEDVTGRRKRLRPGYNKAGALSTVGIDDNNFFVKHISYNAKGQRTLIIYGNQIMTRYVYDKKTFRLRRMRTENYAKVDDVTYRPTGKVFQDYGYEYDLVGNILKIRDRTPGSGIPGTIAGENRLDRSFVYDPLYRLKIAIGREYSYDFAELPAPWSDELHAIDLTLARPYVQEYYYDAAGNLSELKHYSGGTGFSRVFSINANNNQFSTVTVGSTSYVYSYNDKAGNITEETSLRHFEWNHSNRMISFRVQSNNSEPSVYSYYFYDSGGKRIKKFIRKQGGQYTESSVYIDDIFEYRRKKSGAVVEQNNLLHILDNERRIASIRIGAPFLHDNTPSVTYSVGDHLYSSNVTFDEIGSLISREEYTPYGETSFGGFASKKYRYSGKERDEDSSMYYYGARYYAPWLLRWQSCDPEIRHMGGIYNTYTFARNNPIRFTDSEGTQDIDNPNRTTNTSTLSGLVHSESPQQQSGDPGWLSVTGIRVPYRRGADLAPREHYRNPVAAFYAGQGYTDWAELLEAGHVCAACHVTHNIGRIPTNAEFDVAGYVDISRKVFLFSQVAQFGLTYGQMRASWTGPSTPRTTPPTIPSTPSTAARPATPVPPPTTPAPPATPSGPQAGNPAPSFVVTPNGEAIIVPRGATGPVPVVNPQGRTTGVGYTGGSGGPGLDPRTSTVRIMDPTPPRGASPGYPNGYVTYQNRAGQTVNPQTGRTVPRTDPSAHIPMAPRTQPPPQSPSN